MVYWLCRYRSSGAGERNPNEAEQVPEPSRIVVGGQWPGPGPLRGTGGMRIVGLCEALEPFRYEASKSRFKQQTDVRRSL